MNSIDQFEQFSDDELALLREELRGGVLDCFQSGAVLTSFLASRGYGVSADQARVALRELRPEGFTLPRLQQDWKSWPW